MMSNRIDNPEFNDMITTQDLSRGGSVESAEKRVDKQRAKLVKAVNEGAYGKMHGKRKTTTVMSDACKTKKPKKKM